MVLPLPTSPCNSLIMRFGPARSASISASVRACAPVSLNGSAATIALRSLPGAVRTRPLVRRMRSRMMASASWLARSSS